MKVAELRRGSERVVQAQSNAILGAFLLLLGVLSVG
jgi:hypothetical protein